MQRVVVGRAPRPSGGQRQVRDARRGAATRAVVPGQRAVPRPDDLARGGQLVEHRRGVVAARAPAARGSPAPRRAGRTPASCSTTRATPSTPRSAPVAEARADRPTGWTPCQRGRKTPSACGATGSTSARSAASDRRRSGAARRRRRTRRPCRPARRGAGGPARARRLRSSRRSASVTTATPQPNRAAAARAVNGPCVRACRRSRSPTGSGTSSVNTSGTPTGSGDAEGVAQPPGVLDGRPLLGSLRRHAAEPDADHPPGALELDQPARHLVADLPAATRSATSAAVSGPCRRTTSATCSSVPACRSGARPLSSASVRTTASGSSRSASWDSPPCPSSSASSVGSSVSAAARRSASGASPSYRNCAV